MACHSYAIDIQVYSEAVAYVGPEEEQKKYTYEYSCLLRYETNEESIDYICITIRA